MGYRSTHFSLEELVYPELIHQIGDKAWDLWDPKILIVADHLRDIFGPIEINNWHENGSREESGVRKFDTKTGAQWSMHKFFRAVDLHFEKVTPIEVQQYVLAHADSFPLLSCMEDASKTVTWLHCDTRNHKRPEQIWIVEP